MVSDLQARVKQKSILLIIFFIISIAVLVISVVILFPLVASVSKSKYNVLKLFLDIPISNVR